MATFRCYHEDCADDPHGRLGFDFEAPASAPVCPKCGSDGKLPEHKALVVPLVVHHFIHRDRGGRIITDRGRFRLACDVARLLAPGTHATAAPPVVSCKACKATEAYKAAAAKAGTGEVLAEADCTVEFNEATTEAHPRAV